MDISNKTLAIFLVAAIMLSLGGTLLSINRLNRLQTGPTALATSGTGQVNFTILVATDIQIFNATIDFGQGVVNSSIANGTDCSHADLNNNATASGLKNVNGCWVTTAMAGSAPVIINDSRITIQNDGNVNVTVAWDSNANSASNFVGNCSNSAQENAYNYTTKVRADESAYSCTGANLVTTWVNVTNSGTMKLCDELAWEDASDAVDLAFRIKICASNLNTGLRMDNLTITSVAAP